MPGPSSASRSSAETAALVTQVVDELARRLTPDTVLPPDGAGTAGETRRRALQRLHVLAGVKQAVRRLEDQAAHVAAASGAGYPEIGQALNMSRQGARRRWPGLITSSTCHRTPSPTPRSL
ncbi:MULTISPECIES: hypothetical protein [unclassified Streptomyces]|uniref:hypothetical protein n=1 Tax=unclassified Streptomyces TaxID=2593676 RepID=UPI000DB9B9B3|nr:MULTISPECIES: hypothetical protein [unclassified Streptomyces]MYU06360.1 hypothetical protein [Streptomyces sp. SID8366]MYU61556.1 hypothetical protein [Streptomyces sp. SID69]RAJ47949.1 hypothetical protein K376_07138 [Streptomyces sp. PsTaAH-130]